MPIGVIIGSYVSRISNISCSLSFLDLNIRLYIYLCFLLLSWFKRDGPSSSFSVQMRISHGAASAAGGEDRRGPSIERFLQLLRI